MPMYTYRFLDAAGKPTGETVDVHQGFHDNHLTEISGRPVRRAIGNPKFGWKAGFAPSLDKFWDSGDPNDIPKRTGGAK